MGRVISFPVGRTRVQSIDALPKQPTVVVVDDNAMFREILAYDLNRHGYCVRTAEDGKTALTILEKEEIHVLLLDLRLPDLDGFTVLRHVRDERSGPFPYVIVMSGLVADTVRERVYALAANDFLVKPFSFSTLAARLRVFVRRYRQGTLPEQSA